MKVRPTRSSDARGLQALFDGIPLEDRGFIGGDLHQHDVLVAWLGDQMAVRLVCVTGDDELVGMASAWPGRGRSSHVGHVRVVVAPDHRRQGIARGLARQLLVDALRRGLTKLSVEVVAEHQGTIEMFRDIGFEPEALLRDELRDDDGTPHDLVVLSHLAEEAAAAARFAEQDATVE